MGAGAGLRASRGPLLPRRGGTELAQERGAWGGKRLWGSVFRASGHFLAPESLTQSLLPLAKCSCCFGFPLKSLMVLASVHPKLT